MEKLDESVKKVLLVGCLFDREAARNAGHQEEGECNVINNVADLCSEETGASERFAPPVCDETQSRLWYERHNVIANHLISCFLLS